MEVVFKILRYLKGTLKRGLIFSKNDHLQVEPYIDADWAGSLDHRRSTSGYCTPIGGNLVIWRSKKQAVMARSRVEVELRAMTQRICELLCLRILLTELRMEKTDPMRLFGDDKVGINVAHNPIGHDGTKYIEIDGHFIKEKL